MSKARYKLVLIISAVMLSACAGPRGDIDIKRATEINAQLGVGYMAQGRYKMAMVKLKKALSYNDESPLAHHYMAVLHRRLKQNDKAEEHYQLAMKYAPEDSSIQNNYGVFLCEQGKFEKAEGYFNKALSNPLYEAKAAAYENMGLCAYKLGNRKKAEDSLRKSLRLNPKSSKSLLTLSQILFDKGELAGAHAFYSRFTTLAKQNAESLWLGILLERRRGNRNTVSSYALLLRNKYPDSKEARLLDKFQRRNKL